MAISVGGAFFNARAKQKGRTAGALIAALTATCHASLAEPHGIVVRLCKWRHRARKTKQFALRLPPHREWLKQATQCQFCVVGAINDGLNDIGRE